MFVSASTLFCTYIDAGICTQLIATKTFTPNTRILRNLRTVTVLKARVKDLFAYPFIAYSELVKVHNNPLPNAVD